jgi:Ca2+-binding RTX toxin-like protein
LVGTRFNDTLIGDGGDNFFEGHGGLDTLTGGAGHDVFGFYAPLAAGNVATITDFTHAFDVMYLWHSVFTAMGPVGSQPAQEALYWGSAAHDTDDRIIYNPANGNLMYDPDGTGTAAPTTFAVLSPGLNVSSGDFRVL